MRGKSDKEDPQAVQKLTVRVLKGENRPWSLELG